MKSDALKVETTNGPATAFVASPEQPDEDSPLPTVILIQEYWGITYHIKDIAGRYAAEGFLCIAPDLFRGKMARDSSEASKLMQALVIDDGLENIKQTVTAAQSTYKMGKIGITGYCMGGTFALAAACETDEFSAAAVFYGDIPDEHTLSKLKASTIFFAGSRDKWINPEKVDRLRTIARQYNLPVEIVSYDADHAFFNDTRPEVYDAAAAHDAWTRTLALFRKQLAS
jgi:carboxymethylenebutenolidase